MSDFPKDPDESAECARPAIDEGKAPQYLADIATQLLARVRSELGSLCDQLLIHLSESGTWVVHTLLAQAGDQRQVAKIWVGHTDQNYSAVYLYCPLRPEGSRMPINLAFLPEQEPDWNELGGRIAAEVHKDIDTVSRPAS